jgi:hypothetical protein
MTEAPIADDVKRRNTAIALGVAVGLLFWGVIAREWFTASTSNGTHNAGLYGIEVCTPICALKTWDKLRAPGSVMWSGLIAFLFGLKAVALGAHAFAMVLKREPARIKRKWLLASSAITVVACVGFLARFSDYGPFALSYPGIFAIIGGLGLLVLGYRIKA